MSRGVGVAELEGASTPFVILKGYYASIRDYDPMFAQAGLATTDRPEPETWEKHKHWPSMNPDSDSETPPSRLTTEGGFGAPVEPKETILRGAAAAAHGHRVEQENAATRPQQVV